MADNFSPLTINTMIPSSDVKEDELAFLRVLFSVVDSDGALYIYAEDGVSSEHHVETVEDLVEAFPDESARDDWQQRVFNAAVSPDKYDYVTFEWEMFIEAMQRIIARSPTVNYVEVAGAWYCTKMRPGEFGGQAMIITATEVEEIDTYSWVHKTVQRLGLDQPAVCSAA